MVGYINAKEIMAVRFTGRPNKGQTVSGYGGAIPTRYLIRYRRYWYRVKVMQYGNSGSAYITVKGNDEFLGTDAEAVIENAWEALHESQIKR